MPSLDFSSGSVPLFEQKMASSQVEIASSSPFGCVLKDHNRRDRCGKESNAKAAAAAAATQAAFQKNLKELVRDHFHTCISVSSVSSSDENSQNHNVNINNNNNNNINHHNRQHLRCLTNQQDCVDDSSLTMNCKQAKILDRWAAKQAQEMVSTIERQSQEAELLIASQTTSSNSDEKLCGGSNLGASSLVQIWEARLHPPEPKIDQSMKNNNQNVVASTSRTSSVSSNNEIVSSTVEEPPSTVEEPPRQSDVIDSTENEDSLVEWDSTGQSSRTSMHIRNSSDIGENERVRIVDIIKRLTSDSNDHEQGNNSVGDMPSRRHSYGGVEQVAETKALSHILNSPKIRGRQAFNDLLFQMEQERLRELVSLAERQSVSRFPQRGRVQSILKLRCLQRGMAIQDQQRSQSIRSTIASDANKSQQGSTIMHLRERFSAGVDQATSDMNDAATTSKSSKEAANSVVNNGNSPPPVSLNHVIEDDNNQETSSTEQQAAGSAPATNNSLSQTSEVYEEDVHEEASASSDVTWQGTSSEGEHFDPGEILESTQSLNNWDEEEEEETVDQQDFGETNYDWFTDIARPRSYWEDRRQAWYQEMLTTSSNNNEIRQLLERRTVSTFLSSDFRERMDQLMVSHVRRQVNQEDEDIDEESQQRMGQLILSYFQRHSRTAEEEVDEAGREVGEEAEEEEYVEEVDEEEGQVLQEDVDEEEEESLPSIHSPSPCSSWNYSHHQEVAEQVSITPSQLALPSQASNQDRRHFSSITHPSIEMELIFNLRGHMEQLQREMSDLRQCMQTCMEMQAKLMNSLKQEVHPVQEATMNSFDMTTKRRNCCICYERQVDSFLYRCGHMCTCLKCAHELQWSSGKCPMCRAPILDVVRAYMDS